MPLLGRCSAPAGWITHARWSGATDFPAHQDIALARPAKIKKAAPTQAEAALSYDLILLPLAEAENHPSLELIIVLIPKTGIGRLEKPSLFVVDFPDSNC